MSIDYTTHPQKFDGRKPCDIFLDVNIDPKRIERLNAIFIQSSYKVKGSE